MSVKHYECFILALTASLCWAPNVAHAHALAGQRLFPSTLTFDDPGIGAELPMVFSHSHAQGVASNEVDLAVTKPITQSFSLVAGSGYIDNAPDGAAPVQYGWDNFELGGVWQAYVDPDAESIGSLSLNAAFGNTGSAVVDDHFTTISPEFDFGQGFGFLHETWLRPLALTGAVAVDFPTDPDEPRVLNWDFSLQYSLPYLQNFVKYVGFLLRSAICFPLSSFRCRRVWIVAVADRRLAMWIPV